MLLVPTVNTNGKSEKFQDDIVSRATPTKIESEFNQMGVRGTLQDMLPVTFKQHVKKCISFYAVVAVKKKNKPKEQTSKKDILGELWF